LKKFEERMIEATAATDDDDAPRHAGDWCRFCKAAPTCPALADRAQAVAKDEFGEVTEPDSLSIEQLSKTLGELDILEKWCAKVREYAQKQAVDGHAIPGWKLVAKRAIRKWKDEREAAAALELLYALTEEDMHEQKFKSVASIEKLLGKKNAGALSALVVKSSSGSVLVPESDKRPAVRPNASEFEQV
jgi:hypothetical protein